MHDCYPCTWLLAECCIIFLWTELENSNLSDSKTGRSNSAVWKGFSVCLGDFWGFFGLFFLEWTNSIKRDRILSFEKKKLPTTSGLVERARLWNDLKHLNGLWREKINLVQREKKCEEGNEVLMISHTSCVNHCWGSVMTGELLIKAELLVLIDVIAGKSRIWIQN